MNVLVRRDSDLVHANALPGRYFEVSERGPHFFCKIRTCDLDVSEGHFTTEVTCPLEKPMFPRKVPVRLVVLV